MPDGRVEFEITADGKKAFASIDQITDALKKAGVDWEKSAKASTDSIGDSFSGMLKKITAGISAAAIGKALLNIGKDAIQAASDLEEVQNVVDVTFGEAGAQKIESWAQKAGTQFGLTETQAKKFTSTLGAMMKSAGMSGEQVTEMSTDLAGLAADMASFYNLDFDTAFQKIRSGISGETEPLKQLGINMSVANLEAFALSKGITKAFNDMSQGEQTILRYQYLMQATADAQGDFARTSDGLANGTRMLQTNLESLKTKLGDVLLPVINDVVSGINNMMESLTKQHDKTVLDEFAEIDLQTEAKIANIEATAEKARTLTSVLGEIGTQISTNKTDAGKMLDDVPDGKSGKLKDLATNLEGIETQADDNKTSIGAMADNAPDGKEEKITNFKAVMKGISEQGKTNKEVIADMGNAVPKTENVNVLDFAIRQVETTATNAKTSVDAMGDGEPKTQTIKTVDGEIAKVKASADNAKEAIGGMADNPPDVSKLEPVKAEVSAIETSATQAQSAVEGIATPTEQAAEENALWLATCEELVRTLPGLSSIIDVQTGEIKGGTDAVNEYIDAWEEAQKGVVLQGAHERKRGALESKFAELPGLELDMTVAEYRVRKAREQLDGLLQKYGIRGDSDSFTSLTTEDADSYGIGSATMTMLNNELTYYETLKENAEEATKAYNTQKEAYDEAVAAYEEEGKAIKATYGEAIEAVDAWTEEQQAAASEAVSAFDEALKAVDEYYSKVREATSKEVNKSFGGFKEIKLAADTYKEAANAAEDYAKKLEEARKKGKNSLTDDEIKLKADAKNKQITAEGMKNALQSQVDYIEEYQENLKAVKETGLIRDEILAELSDGSEESAQYLYAMAEAAKSGDTATLGEINELWKTAQSGKETFIDTLTQQRLAVDEQYDAMVKKAEEAAAALDVSGTAGESTGKNITAMANAIKDHVPEVAEQVDSVLGELNRLAAWGVDINVSFGASGGDTFMKPGSGIGADNVIQGEYETGLDRVPFDGFLASLHEGEGILTAEENRIWQRFKAGQPGMDYDTLGGVMRDNIKPGGNVYLDGRQVGTVVSQIQGNQYRTMQRSGWQG